MFPFQGENNNHATGMQDWNLHGNDSRGLCHEGFILSIRPLDFD